MDWSKATSLAGFFNARETMVRTESAAVTGASSMGPATMGAALGDGCDDGDGDVVDGVVL